MAATGVNPHRTPVTMRSGRKQAEYALQASPNNPVKGVKGLPVIELLPSFDTVRGIATYYMHSVCLGAKIMTKNTTLVARLM